MPILRILLCLAAVLVLLASLPLPAVHLTSNFAGKSIGLGCLIGGIFFYPSNLALIASPLLAASPRSGWRRSVGVFLLFSLGAALLLTLTPALFWKTYIGFWLWCASLAIAGVALLLPGDLPVMASKADQSEPKSEI